MSPRTPIDALEMKRFAQRVQALRNEQGLSQSDLARLIWGEQTDKLTGRRSAKNRDRISCYERGKSLPDPHNLQELAKALGVPPEELLPDRIGTTTERENPEVSIVTVAGRVHLRINKLVSFDEATAIMAVLNRPA
jgi:transcriptional regulator with XRE-family HTH domain